MVAFTCEGSGHFGVRPAPFLQACCAFLRANLYDGKKSVPREAFPDVADPTGPVASSAEWPPEWVKKLHFKVEVNRAMNLKEWNAARKAEAEANPAAPSAAATEDMGEVVAEEGLGGALAEFEEMAAGGAGGGGGGESKG